MHRTGQNRLSSFQMGYQAISYQIYSFWSRNFIVLARARRQCNFPGKSASQYTSTSGKFTPGVRHLWGNQNRLSSFSQPAGPTVWRRSWVRRLKKFQSGKSKAGWTLEHENDYEFEEFKKEFKDDPALKEFKNDYEFEDNHEFKDNHDFKEFEEDNKFQRRLHFRKDLILYI